MEKYVLVIGDSESGKTSLIRSIVSEQKKKHSNKKQQKQPISSSSTTTQTTIAGGTITAAANLDDECTPFTLETGGNTYSVNFIDTNNDWDTIAQHKYFIVSDLVLFVMEGDRDEALDSLENNWLPIIQQAKKSLFIVQNKIDIHSNYQQVDLHQVYDRFVGSIGYSSLTREGRDDLVYEIFNYMFLSPTIIVYDYDKRELRPLAIDALRRVFWLLDKDHDSKLNAKEFAKYLKLSGVEYTQQEFLEAVQANNSDITFDKFVQFQQYLINNTRNINAVWNILRAFNFNSALMVDDRALIEKSMPRSSTQDLIILKDTGYVELTRLFKTFDLDNDGLLSLDELNEAFSICFDFENPFARIDADYLTITATEDDKLTIDGWLALWSLATLQNPYSILKCLIRWGVKNRLGEMLVVKKKRKYRQSTTDYPNIINAYVFGPSRCGKTSLMHNLIEKNVVEDVYVRTSVQNSVVNIVEDDKGEQYYLAITEFEDTEVLSVLESEHIMEKCDVAIMMFDGNDPHSFSYLAKLQQKLDPTIPCAYVLSKFDLPPVDQFHDVPPNEFCEELSLPWPPIYHSAVDTDGEQQTFEDILYFALNPKDACPIWDAVDDASDSDDEVEGAVEPEPKPKSSLLSRTIKLVGFVSVLAVGSALLWKFVAKPKKNSTSESK